MVDDDKFILNLLEYVFHGKNGYEVRTFSNGESCLESLHLNPDLVVLDYILDHNGSGAMDGLEILRRLLEKNNELPVIVLSSFVDEKIRNTLIENGARIVLRKDDYFIDRLEKYVVFQLN